MSIIEKAVDKLEKRTDARITSLNEESVEPKPVSRGQTEKIRLPFEQLKVRGIVTPDAQRSRIAEEYRTIKRPLK